MICAIGILLALPNLFDDGKISNFSNLLPSNKINLGLDLRGGSHLLLEVDAGYIVNEKLEYLLDETRLSLRKSNIKYKNLSVKDSTLSFISLIESQSDQIKEIIAELSADISGSANTGKSFLVV